MTILFHEGWNDETSNWALLNHTTDMHTDNVGNSFASVTFKFQRRPTFYTWNLFCPGILLTILELNSFSISPDSADRTSYAVTVMVAMFIVHSQILSYLPKSPEPILAANYVMAEMIIGTCCTVYSGFLSWWISKAIFLRKKVEFRSFKFRLFIAIDCIVFVIFVTAVVLLNIISLSFVN